MSVQAVTSDTPARQDKNGDEKVITLQDLRDALPNLTQLKTNADAANVELKDAIKATAEKSGLLAVAVRALVNARAKGNVNDKARQAEQMSLVFGEIGENDAAKMN